MKCISASMAIAYAVLSFALPATGNPAGSAAREVIERVLREASERSGRRTVEDGAKLVAVETLKRMTGKYGDAALRVAREGGIELVEAVPHHGDEVFEIAMKLSPEGRRTLARELPELLSLAKRSGIEAVELEARAPGLGRQAFTIFGDDGGRYVAKGVPTEDVPRLIQYGSKADNPATRKLLLEKYQVEGKSLFERIPPKLVLAGGLSGAMLYGTNRVTEPLKDSKVAMLFFVVAGLVVVVIVSFLLGRFGLLPWQHTKRERVGTLAQPRENGIGD